MSAAPQTMRSPTVIGNIGRAVLPANATQIPTPMMATPQMITQMMAARPCRWIRDTPAGEDAAGKRTERNRREQQRKRETTFFGAAEALVGHLREQRSRHPEDHQRHQPENTGQPDIRGAAGELIDLGGDSDHRQLRTDDRDDVRPPQATKMWVFERGGVNEEAAGHARRPDKPSNIYGCNLVTAHRASTSVHRTRLCNRFARPCQNSTSTGSIT